QKRLNNADILARDLITGLSSYSERGEDYIEELRAMIRINRPIVERVSEELNPPPQPE
ncbi:MAG TPA: peptidoglycan hydrolase, partial [Idiomarina abyssalis]|nr:peptidoglycan hydrolase [Idiomarina abyssalis]